MPDHLRALVVVLAIAAACFAVVRRVACASAMSPGDFARRRNAWFAVTLAMFLAHQFWVYIAAAAVILVIAARHEKNVVALALFVVLAVPPIYADIPGFGLSDALFTIDYLRLLNLVLFVPAWLALRRAPQSGFGRLPVDWLILGYVALNVALMLPVQTFTNAIRQGALYGCIDVLLPYYVVSRSLKDLAALREALMALLVGSVVIGGIAVFEYARHWLLYSSLDGPLGVRWDYGAYLGRGESLRAMATTGQPIVLGFVMALALGASLYLQRAAPRGPAWLFCLAALGGALVASLSRGPWIGAALMVVIFVALGARPLVRLAQLGLVALAAGGALLVLPGGSKVIDYLPFVGSVEAENITYRQRLIEVSLQLIREHPFFGMPNFLSAPAMQEMRQGGGIIDIVNSYVAIALRSGLVGLALYVGIFLAVMVGIARAMRAVGDRGDERYAIGQMLIAVLVGLLLIISTVSSIMVIPQLLWTLAGLGAAYASIIVPARSGLPAAAAAMPRGAR